MANYIAESTFASNANTSTPTVTLTAPTADHRMVALVVAAATLNGTPTVSVSGGSVPTVNDITTSKDVHNVEIHQFEWLATGLETTFNVVLNASVAACISVREFANITNSNPAWDVATSSITAGPSATPSSGTTASTSQADEIGSAGFGYINPGGAITVTGLNGWADATNLFSSGSANNVQLHVADLVISSIGTQNWTPTLSAAPSTISGSIATIKVVTAAAQTSSPQPVIAPSRAAIQNSRF